MKEKISFFRLKKVLSPKEMKNITGGSTYYCECYDGTGMWTCYNAALGSDCGLKEYCWPGGGVCNAAK